jgi:hypothetical protein
MKTTKKTLAAALCILAAASIIGPSLGLTQPGARTPDGHPVIFGTGTPSRISTFIDDHTIGDSVIAAKTNGLWSVVRIDEPFTIRGGSGNSFVDFRGPDGLRVRVGAHIPIMIWDDGQREVARFDADGNLGIGTSTPVSTLEVVGTITSDTVHAGTGGFMFPDGTVQTTAATSSGGFSGFEIIRREFSGTAGFGSEITWFASPPTGKLVIGGGARLVQPLSANIPLITSAPEGNGWRAMWMSSIFQVFNYDVEIYLICIDAP